MSAQQRQRVFMDASGVAVLLALICILYLAGAVIATTSDHKRAAVSLVVAVVAAVIASGTRPAAQPAR